VNEARVLIIDGNRAATREQQVAAGGKPSGEGYAQVLQELGAVRCDIVRPADGEVRWAAGSGLSDYDGVAMTGSALNVYDGGAHIERQIELARAVLESGVPFFGSCWGLQVAVTAAGGQVRRNLGDSGAGGVSIAQAGAVDGEGARRDKPVCHAAAAGGRGGGICSADCESLWRAGFADGCE